MSEAREDAAEQEWTPAPIVKRKGWTYLPGYNEGTGAYVWSPEVCLVNALPNGAEVFLLSKDVVISTSMPAGDVVVALDAALEDIDESVR
jgi:hypothetical protein